MADHHASDAGMPGPSAHSMFRTPFTQKSSHIKARAAREPAGLDAEVPAAPKKKKLGHGHQESGAVKTPQQQVL